MKERGGKRRGRRKKRLMLGPVAQVGRDGRYLQGVRVGGRVGAGALAVDRVAGRVGERGLLLKALELLQDVLVLVDDYRLHLQWQHAQLVLDNEKKFLDYCFGELIDNVKLIRII